MSPHFTLFSLRPDTITDTIFRMGSITKRQRKNGQVSYRAQVRVRRDGADRSDSATFSKRSLASSWIKRREAEIEAEIARGGAEPALPRETVADLVGWYIDAWRDVLRWGRNKDETLRQIAGQPIGGAQAAALTAGDLVEYARVRRSEGAGPSTVGGALTWIGVVFQAAEVAGYAVDPAVVAEARRVCRRISLTGHSGKRTRRPSPDEIAALHAEFARGQARGFVPMSDIVDFAIASSRRRDEIVRLRWSDNDAAALTGMVRDAKHPTHKWGNHRRFKYTRAAWDIVQRQPRDGDLIFPYNGPAVTARFVRACRRAGIVDLRFHDLRHEATSRLFEAGGTITEVQQYTLHESWDMLRRYTQLRPEDVRQL